MTGTPYLATIEADRALRTKHRAMWALGDYPAVAADVIPELGAIAAAASGFRLPSRMMAARSTCGRK